MSEIFSGIKGVDYADLYMQSGVSHSIMYEDGRMDTLSSSVSDGLGVRIVRGDNTVYAHTMGTDASSIRMAIGEAQDMSGADISSPGDECESPFVPVMSLPSLDTGFFHDLDTSLRGECKYLRQVTFRYRTSRKSLLIVRGDGSIARDERAYTTFAASVVLERDGELETGYEARSFGRTSDDFWSVCGADGLLTAESIARRALSRGLLMLDAIPCPAGAMMVLMDGTAGGTMIHEACGHGLEADIVRKDFSTYRDMTGKTVAAPIVTIVDDATLPDMYGSYRCDDEGTPAGRTVLVENGVLRRYMTDISSANLGGLPRTGNGRRESYQHIPLPRMSNTFITPGESERGEMLEMMKDGIIVKKMGGGEVNPTSGDFVFHVSEGYLVKDGKIGSPVKGATLTGNGPKALWNIIAVGRELILDPGVCGKSGQGVPVTDGQPTLLIKNLTVGGSDAGNVS
jgi:TldD protein